MMDVKVEKVKKYEMLHRIVVPINHSLLLLKDFLKGKRNGPQNINK